MFSFLTNKKFIFSVKSKDKSFHDKYYVYSKFQLWLISKSTDELPRT